MAAKSCQRVNRTYEKTCEENEDEERVNDNGDDYGLRVELSYNRPS
jgi:hypothetical protein